MPTNTQPSTLNALREYFQKNNEAILKDYFTFLRFQSISTESEYAKQMKECTDWLVKYLKKMGFETELLKTGSGHPTIMASYNKAGPDQPTLLLYHHYDVQPVDPIEAWETPPFEPAIRNGEVYAQGAQDNKGQCFYTLLALKTMLEREKQLPINVKLCIEGEEEAGSVSLAEQLKQQPDKFKADYIAIVDLGLREKTKPSITLGIRGLVTMDVDVQGSKTDLHSGCHGGLVYNPIHALVELLASLRDSSGKIAIPGFYDDVIPLSDEDRRSVSWKFDKQKYQEMFGVLPTGGERDLSPLERNWVRPTLEINGISGGYSGSGFKTVIPAKAHAKISCRLVPNQQPKKMGEMVARYLEQRAPSGVQVRVHVHPGGGQAVHAKAGSTVVKAFDKAFSEVFQAPCEYIYEGASIPIVPQLVKASNGELVLVGLGLGDDQIHAPNEHFGIDRIEKGFLVITRALELLRK